MERQRDIRDYQLLVTVRRRQGLSLQEVLRNADAELAHYAARLAACETDWRESIVLRDDYARKLRERTTPGTLVRPAELDAARHHGLALTSASEASLETCRQAEVSRAESAARRDLAARQVTANDCRVEALVDQIRRWKEGAAHDAEEREEEARDETVRRRQE